MGVRGPSCAGSCYSTLTGKQAAGTTGCRPSGRLRDRAPYRQMSDLGAHWRPFNTCHAGPDQGWARSESCPSPEESEQGMGREGGRGGVFRGASTPHCPRPAVRGQKLSAATGNQSHQVRRLQAPLTPPELPVSQLDRCMGAQLHEGLGAPVMQGQQPGGDRMLHVRTLGSWPGHTQCPPGLLLSLQPQTRRASHPN